MKRLVEVRKRTSALLHWLTQHTKLELLITFSGGKGFHVVLRDPDRTPFEVAEPREREGVVREHRQALLERVMAAGHAVDPTVTADTRRIIRVPAASTGARGGRAPSPRGLIHQLRRWVSTLPRATDAEVMPKRPPRQAKRRARQQPAAPRPERLSSAEHPRGGHERQDRGGGAAPSKINDERRLESSTPFPTTWLRSRSSRLEAVSCGRPRAFPAPGRWPCSRRWD